ncbi:MAG: DUF1015 domain-containing protein [candidate division Zixibacteria bacterium]|nr:DUF1015 domain-containing protein [candidate division Zixibacteria bacterium]
MSIIRPFRGLRPQPQMAREVASPPYDVLSSAEAREIVKSNPNSFLRINKAEIDFDESANPYGDEVYRRGKDNLQRLIDENIMVRDERPSFYLYRLTWQGRSQTGLITLTSVEEYDAGKIKKHEHTRPEKVSDRADHITFLEAQVGPVFSTFRHDATISAIFDRITATPPTTKFDADDDVTNELWVVDDTPTVDELIAAFAKLSCLYIADGHHRSQSASEVCRRFKGENPNHTGEEPYNFFLNVLFADSELRILAYNRVVNDLNGLTIDDIMKQSAKHFEITPQTTEVNPENPHVFGIYADSKWYRLESKPGSFEATHPTKSIDASILADNLIAPLFGITDPKTDKRINFVGGIRGNAELVKLVDSGDYKIAFSLHPTSITQLLNVADAGEVMPPKSTWFEPKLRSGMVVNLLKD